MALLLLLELFIRNYRRQHLTATLVLVWHQSDHKTDAEQFIYK